eukprot:1306856-Rhodomonas_salina.1
MPVAKNENISACKHDIGFQYDKKTSKPAAKNASKDDRTQQRTMLAAVIHCAKNGAGLTGRWVPVRTL